MTNETLSQGLHHARVWDTVQVYDNAHQTVLSLAGATLVGHYGIQSGTIERSDCWALLRLCAVLISLYLMCLWSPRTERTMSYSIYWTTWQLNRRLRRPSIPFRTILLRWGLKTLSKSNYEWLTIKATAHDIKPPEFGVGYLGLSWLGTTRVAGYSRRQWDVRLINFLKPVLQLGKWWCILLDSEQEWCEDPTLGSVYQNFMGSMVSTTGNLIFPASNSISFGNSTWMISAMFRRLNCMKKVIHNSWSVAISPSLRSPRGGLNEQKGDLYRDNHNHRGTGRFLSVRNFSSCRK